MRNSIKTIEVGVEIEEMIEEIIGLDLIHIQAQGLGVERDLIAEIGIAGIGTETRIIKRKGKILELDILQIYIATIVKCQDMTFPIVGHYKRILRNLDLQ